MGFGPHTMRWLPLDECAANTDNGDKKVGAVDRLLQARKPFCLERKMANSYAENVCLNRLFIVMFELILGTIYIYIYISNFNKPKTNDSFTFIFIHIVKFILL